MRIIISVCLLVLFISGCDTVNNDNPAGKINNIMIMDAHVEEENLDVLLENKFSNIKVPAEIYIDNERIAAYLEPQGAGSRYFSKWGYTITCGDEYTVYGLQKFNLSIQPYDKTKIKTTLASWLYKQMGFPVFYSNHSFLKVNNSAQGLYVLTERIEDGFFERRNLTPYELIKVVFGAKFTYSATNTLADNFEKKIPDDGNFNNLAEFIYAIDTTKRSQISGLSSYVDIDQYLKYHALTCVMNNSDGITNNFYLYKRRPDTPYEMIPWDFDKTFDPRAPIALYSGNELMEKLMQNDTLKSIYNSHLKNILVNIFKKENMYPIIDSVYNKISAAYSLDPYLNNAVSLEYEINLLKSFIINRRDDLLKQLDL